MALGIDLARDDAPEHAKIMEMFKEQIILALVNKLGGSVELSVQDVDSTGELVLYMSVDQEKSKFHFKVKKKS